jgi:hypothetical protein
VKRIIIILAVTTTTVCILASCVVETIPPGALTATRMQALKRRVLQYARAHDRLTSSLAALPPMEGYDNSVKDGWKRDILFEISAAGVVSFSSLGRDGVVGGSGESADIVRSFPSRDAQGNWSDEVVEWSEDTFKR